MDIIDELSTKLIKFKKTGKNYTFRCPYCGDSTKNNFKTRGYLFKTNAGNYAYKCHNCGVNKSLSNFLSDHFTDLHKSYTFDKFIRSTDDYAPPIIHKPKHYKLELFSKFPLISELHKDHAAKKYIISRKLPQSLLSEVYFVSEWKKFVNSVKPTYKSTEFEESRIVVPLIINFELVGFQGRLVGTQSGIRYMTIMLVDAPKIYGCDHIDWAKPVYVVEGIYDSLFVPNCIAMLGSDINLEFLEQHKDSKFIFLFDNEPYSQQIIQKMNKIVFLGYSVCIWVDGIKEKDLNDCILAGVDVSKVVNNHYSGIRAKLEISRFSKCVL
jgi:hypothetical protein